MSLRHMVDRPFRKPGEHLWAFPDAVWSEYDCDHKSLPYFEIEYHDLYPRRLSPGDEFSHRLVYVLCPEKPTGVVTGALDTRILHRGDVIVAGRDLSYDLKPGRWVIDRFVRLPQSAQVGVYALEVSFRDHKLGPATKPAQNGGANAESNSVCRPAPAPNSRNNRLDFGSSALRAICSARSSYSRSPLPQNSA